MDKRRVNFYMQLARLAAKESHANRRKVGACAIQAGQSFAFDKILGVSYNGTEPGHPNACEDESGLTLNSVWHAERNLARYGRSLLKATHLFVTKEPCVHCARFLCLEAPNLQMVYWDEVSNSAHGQGLVLLHCDNQRFTP